MSIVLVGSTSGSVTLQEPAVAGTTVLDLPATSGTVVVTGTTPTLNGITFPATQVPSADANTLDDYEEGGWTPTDGSGAGLSLNVVYAKYTKIGRLVTVTTYFEYPSTASSAQPRISGLPFTLEANGFSTGALSSGAAQIAFVRGQAGNSSAQLFAINATGALTNANFSTQFVIFTFSYQVT
jgi:hypothetical protein